MLSTEQSKIKTYGLEGCEVKLKFETGLRERALL